MTGDRIDAATRRLDATMATWPMPVTCIGCGRHATTSTDRVCSVCRTFGADDTDPVVIISDIRARIRRIAETLMRVADAVDAGEMTDTAVADQCRHLARQLGGK